MSAEGRHAAELLGEAGSGSAGHGLLADAVECGEDESNDVGLVTGAVQCLDHVRELLTRRLVPG